MSVNVGRINAIGRWRMKDAKMTNNRLRGK
jgi:hypothetical protein